MSGGYDFEFSLEKQQSAHAIQFGMVPEMSKVLDVGCHTGIMGEILRRKKGCVVTGIESDSAAALEAKELLNEVLEIDIEESDWQKKINDRFDVILFGDVLEHTRNPELILSASKQLLKSGGKVIVSLPNIANLRIRLGLLRGKFDYDDSGILDRTHLRFYTKSSATKLLIDSGLRVIEARAAGYSLPYWLINVFPKLLATQFIFLCEPKLMA
jgi:methionine biosynthesis protein MetW